MGNRDKYTRIDFNRDQLAELLARAGLNGEQVNGILGYGTDDTDSHGSYWSTVDALAAEVLERVNDGTDEGDALFEACDGNYWSIYTHAAQKALIYSDNESAYMDEMGELPKAEDWSTLVCALAAWALMADVREKYSDLVKEQEDHADEESETEDEG